MAYVPITNVITDLYNDMIKKLLIEFKNQEFKYSRLVEKNDELEEKKFVSRSYE